MFVNMVHIQFMEQMASLATSIIIIQMVKPFILSKMVLVAKTEHSHPLGMVVSTHFRCGKGVKRGLKNGALPFTID